jgi:hypothetical protein
VLCVCRFATPAAGKFYSANGDFYAGSRPGVHPGRPVLYFRFTKPQGVTPLGLLLWEARLWGST